MGIEVRSATSADRDRVVALWQQAGLTRPWNDPQADFALALGSAGSTVLLAEQSGALRGCAMAGLDGHRGWVYYLATDPQARGLGIGRMLMDAAEDWLKARGSSKIQLMVRGDNAAARGFYDALGYELQDVVTLGKWL